MTGLPAEFASPWFWGVATATGILWSLLASYLRSAMDRALSVASRSAKTRATARADAWRAQVDAAVHDPSWDANLSEILRWGFSFVAVMLLVVLLGVAMLISKSGIPSLASPAVPGTLRDGAYRAGRLLMSFNLVMAAGAYFRFVKSLHLHWAVRNELRRAHEAGKGGSE